ncbi:MAG: two-component hybrid sensor and regulator [Prosthecobacter sp.]|nr:two-component hybrid sensor and regulator [Prosthecobacter sp.]
MPTKPPSASPSASFEKIVEMNVALIQGAVRQHELTEKAENLNAKLRAEIQAREEIANELSEKARELADKARLLDLTQDAIIVRDTEGRILYWNGGAEKLYGWSCAEARGQLSHVLLQTEFSMPEEQMVEELHRTNHWTGELAHTTRDGRRLTVFVRKNLDRDSQGRPAAVMENITNITERKMVEEALRASEERYRSIITSSPDCIKLLDLEGVLLSVEAGHDLLGLADVTPLLGGSWIEFWLRAKDQAAARSAVTDAAAGRSGSFVGFFRTLDGQDKWWDVAVTPILDASGQPARLVAVLRDVTERRALEDALVARAEDLMQADRSKDEFLAMLAHELRNPLAPLRNAAELLTIENASAEDREQAQRVIRRQIENMSRMLDDLLDVSRITEGKIELRKKPVPLEGLLIAAASLVRSTCATQQQELTLTLPAKPVYLNCDATRLEQVFGNLLTNACKYSGVGSRISISAERDDNAEPPEVIIIVRDDGLGIAPELLPHVFGLFVQSTRSLDRSHGGLGIGLTLVQRLVKLHGGSVEARSEGLGQGAEFIVSLPILNEVPAPVSDPPVSEGRDFPRRILIVDDNTDSAQSLAALQRRRGHETRTAFTGPDALKEAVEFLPDVVLLDIGLPGMDGFEVARQLRLMPQFQDVQLIAMSGYGSPEDRATGRKAGFDEHLVKPVELDVLRECLRRVKGSKTTL